MGDYLAGLWSNHILRCLAWEKAEGQLEKALEVYRAPSWSWAAVDGVISYRWENWEDSPPFSASAATSPQWLDKHNPRLVEHHMIPKCASGLFMGVSEGSYLLLDGNCINASAIRQSTSHFNQVSTHSVVHPDTSDNIELQYGLGKLFQGEKEVLYMQLQWRMPNPIGEILEVCAVLL